MRTVSLLGSWVARDFRVRTTQTALGAFWAVANPIVVTLGFVFAFHGVANLNAGVPYASFVFPGLLLWNLFSGGFARAMGATAGSMYIASKANFPRIVPPVAAALLASVDLGFGLVLLPVFLVVQRAGGHVLIVPILAAFAGTLALTIGLGVIASALSIFIRDLQNILPLVMQLGLFLTPVAYPISQVSGASRALVEWNPMATFVTGFRSGLLHVPGPELHLWLRALGISLVFFLVGVWYFKRVESRFPDVA